MAEVEEGVEERGASLPLAPRDRPIALSYAQDRYWLLSLLEPGNAIYHLCTCLRLRGSLRVESLQAALSAVQDRHEALRTVVAVVENRPVQKIVPACALALRVVDHSTVPDPFAAARAEIAALRAQPFDLAVAPLWRTLLVRVADDDHVLAIVAHRMVVDERALAIVLEDLAAAYDGPATAPHPAPAALQFADFAHWQCAQAHGDGFAAHADYWKRTLAGELPVLDLATDFPRPPRTAYAAGEVSFSMPAEQLGDLDQLAQRAQASRFAVAVAGMALVLGRHGGTSDLVLGTPGANRDRPGTQRLVGRLATMLPLRLAASPRASVVDYVAHVADRIEEARRHQELPFERLLEDLGLAKDLSRHPLFQIVIEEDAATLPAFAGLVAAPFPSEPAGVMFDLHVRVSGDAEGMHGRCTYATSLFKPDRVARLMAQATRAMAWLARNPQSALDDFALLDEDETRVLVVERNRNARPFPRDTRVHEAFEAMAAQSPDATAVVCGERTLSYAELNRRANRLGRYLQQQGVGPDQRVGVCMDRSVDAMVAILAVLKASAVYVPIDPQYPADRQAHMIRDAEAKLVLGQKHLADKIPSALAPVFLVDQDLPSLAHLASENLPRSADGERLLYMIFTSGSTGKPKGSLVYHHGFMNLLAWYRSQLALSADSRFLVFSSLSFDLTQKNLFAPLLCGGTLVLLDTPYYDAARILDLVDSHAITVVNCTPSAFYGLLADASLRSLSRLRSLRHVVLGGEAISLQRLEPWYSADFCRATVVNSYGPTECTDVCAFHALERGRPYPWGVPLGRAVPNTQLYILDQQQRLVPDGAVGELCIAGVGVGAGYVNRPELDAAKFLANRFGPGRIYRTGDRARYLPDGEIAFLGRADHQVKLHGYRIELGEVTAALDGVPEIGAAYVMVREDEGGDTVLVAYVVPASPSSELSLPALRQRLGELLPDYMVPTVFVPLAALPLSPNGKVDRAKLPAPRRDRAARATETAGAGAPAGIPSGQAEAFVAEAWRTLLGAAQVGVHDRFFDLGGTSLKAIQFVGAMGQSLGVSLPMVTLFEAPTVAQFVAALKRKFPDAFRARFPGDDLGGAPAPGARAVATVPVVNTGRGWPEIAIIGMALRLPGANTLDEFWSNLKGGVESIRRLSDEELLQAGVPPTLVADPGYVKVSASMDQVEEFDADFFRMLPREVELMDPQHRVVLECAYSALEHAGYAADSDRHRVGVFAGVARDAYLTSHLLRHPDLMAGAGDYALMIGNEKDFPATRVAYKLDLHGPAVNLQTACSSSGVGIHLACQCLVLDDCDMALVGGARVLTPSLGYPYVEGGTLSPDGHVRAFDAKGRGMVRGSGAAFVLLKRADRARADGDCVYAVIKGSAINNDGAGKVGFTAPSVSGQAAVIRAALDRAGVHPDTITYLEAHGTATALGDPIEIAAATEAFRAYTQRTGYCAVGSVKTNIGHLDAGSCVAGIIKTALAMRHGQIPPSLNFETPNPQIDFANSPFFVADRLRDWSGGDGPRRAGVSSFGLGGTNAHVILEEGDAAVLAPDATSQVLVLSARTPTALAAAEAALADHLERHPEVGLADVAFTLQTCRNAHPHRRALVCGDAASAIAQLRAPPARRSPRVDRPPSLVFMFPGQGSQHVGMGHALYQNEPRFRACVDRCCQILEPALGVDLRDVMYPSAGAEAEATTRLMQTALAQPAIFTVAYASAQLWLERGVRPAALIGHSVGELAAACLADVFSLEDALAVLAARARLMQAMPPGSMRAVRMSEAEVTPYLGDGLSLAAINAPSSCVVSGPSDLIAAFDRRLEDKGISSIVLHTSHAFHSAMMDPVVPALEKALSAVARSRPNLAIVSTLTGDWLTAEQATDPGYWARQLRMPVRFSQAFETARSSGERLFLDLGPSTALATVGLRHVQGEAQERVVASMPRADGKASADATFLAALGRCWGLGVAVDWQGLHAGKTRRRVGLPTYPFERKRFWLAAPSVDQPGPPQAPGVAQASVPPADANDDEAKALSAVFQEQLRLIGKQLDALAKLA